MLQRTSIYQATWPKATHWRTATCEAVDCPHYLMGWVTRVIRGSANDAYIKHDTKRRWTVAREGDLNAYYFEAGQQCYRSEAGVHFKRLERGAWLTRDAIDRNPQRLEQVAMEPQRWIDEFNEAAQKNSRR